MKTLIYKLPFLFLVITLLLNCATDREAIKTAPQLSTNLATNINITSASSGGNVTSDGGASVIARGIVWSTSTTPTINLSTKTTDGSGTGTFTSAMTNLTPSTNYFVRAYATNNVGTGYGNEVTFTTGAVVPPTVTTTASSSISGNSAMSGGNVTSDGGGVVTARGVVWSTSQNPTIALSTKTTDGTGTGNFSSSISGISPSTKYYVRAYATNTAGTAYGNEVALTTLTPNYAAMYPAGTVFCNNVVTAVVDVTNPITGKTWMDRNLGASRVATSSTDTQAYGDLYQWGRRADGHQCRNSPTTSVLSNSDVPPNVLFISSPYPPSDWRSPQSSNLWQGVNGINNPCPNGYRLPTFAETNQEKASWNSYSPDSAFSSPLKLPAAGGRSIYDGAIINEGTDFYIWTSSVINVNSDTLNKTIYTSPAASGVSRGTGASVRCIKN